MAAPLPDPAADAPREAFRLTIEGGETDQAAAAAGVATDGREHRHLEVKGRTQPVDVVVVRT